MSIARYNLQNASEEIILSPTSNTTMFKFALFPSNQDLLYVWVDDSNQEFLNYRINQTGTDAALAPMGTSSISPIYSKSDDRFYVHRDGNVRRIVKNGDSYAIENNAAYMLDTSSDFIHTCTDPSGEIHFAGSNTEPTGGTGSVHNIRIHKIEGAITYQIPTAQTDRLPIAGIKCSDNYIFVFTVREEIDPNFNFNETPYRYDNLARTYTLWECEKNGNTCMTTRQSSYNRHQIVVGMELFPETGSNKLLIFLIQADGMPGFSFYDPGMTGLQNVQMRDQNYQRGDQLADLKWLP